MSLIGTFCRLRYHEMLHMVSDELDLRQLVDSEQNAERYVRRSRDSPYLFFDKKSMVCSMQGSFC